MDIGARLAQLATVVSKPAKIPKLRSNFLQGGRPTRRKKVCHHRKFVELYQTENVQVVFEQLFKELRIPSEHEAALSAHRSEGLLSAYLVEMALRSIGSFGLTSDIGCIVCR
jgi:hypothetical protein